MAILSTNSNNLFLGNIGQVIDVESFNLMVVNTIQDLITIKQLQSDYLNQIDLFESRIVSDILGTINSSAKSIEALIEKFKYLNNSKRFTVADFFNLFDNTSLHNFYISNLDDLNIYKISKKLSELKYLNLSGGKIRADIINTALITDHVIRGVIDTEEFLLSEVIYDSNENFATNFDESEDPIGNTYYFITTKNIPIELYYEITLASAQSINFIELANISDLPFNITHIEFINGNVSETLDVNTILYYKHIFRFATKTANKIILYFTIDNAIKSNILLQQSLQGTLQALVNDPSLYTKLVSENQVFNESLDYKTFLFYIYSLGIEYINFGLETVTNEDSIALGKPVTVKKIQDFALSYDTSSSIYNQTDPLEYPNETIPESYFLIENFAKSNILLDRDILSIPSWNKSIVKELVIFTQEGTIATGKLRFPADITISSTLYENGNSKAFSVDNRDIQITVPYTLANGAVSAGATTINVDSASLFPSSGSAYFTDTDDVFTYTGTTATSFTGVTGVNSNHPDNTPISGFFNTTQYIYEYTPAFVNGLKTINVHELNIPVITDEFIVEDGEIVGANIAFQLTTVPDQSENIDAFRIYTDEEINDTNFTITNERTITFAYDPLDPTYTNSIYRILYTPLVAIDSGDRYVYKSDGSITTNLKRMSPDYEFSKIYPLIVAYNIQQQFSIDKLSVLATSNTQVNPRINYNDGSLVELTQIQYGVMVDLNIPILNLGTTPSNADDMAKRILMTNADNPADDLSSLLISNWNPDDSLNTYEGVTVNGILKHDINKDPVQYATFFLRRSAVSQFKIYVVGTYSGMWVKMFGISGLTNTTNDWLNMYSNYDGSGIPGKPPNGSGCAIAQPANSETGTFICTFGEETSTNSTNNIILLRFRLEAGNEISRLELRGL